MYVCVCIYASQTGLLSQTWVCRSQLTEYNTSALPLPLDIRNPPLGITSCGGCMCGVCTCVYIRADIIFHRRIFFSDWFCRKLQQLSAIMWKTYLPWYRSSKVLMSCWLLSSCSWNQLHQIYQLLFLLF